MSIYLKVPQINGDVTDSQHAGWIRLHSLDWGCERVPLHEPGRIHHRSFSTPHFSSVTLTKKIDQASPLLFVKSCSSLITCECIIRICDSIENAVHYLEYTLGGVFFSAFHHLITNNALDHELYEKIKLDYNHIKMRYLPRDASGSATAPVISAYDLNLMEAV